jgi:hypothetical protein
MIEYSEGFLSDLQDVHLSEKAIYSKTECNKTKGTGNIYQLDQILKVYATCISDRTLHTMQLSRAKYPLTV